MFPIFIGGIKSSSVQHGGTFNIMGTGGILNTPVVNQKLQAGQFNSGDFNPSMNLVPITDPDVIDNPSPIIKGL